VSNFIADQNPFKLAAPPDFFLRRLFEFDDTLVIVPSRQGHYYRLALRRQPRLTTAIVNDALWKESDTQMLASYGLVPVTTILPTANWFNPALFEELRRRSVTMMGGHEAVNARLEEQEALDEAKKAAETDDALNVLSKDGWGLYQKKIGVKTHMWSPTVKRSGSGAAPTHKWSSKKAAPDIQVASIFSSPDE
jgi:hypothetical protein